MKEVGIDISDQQSKRIDMNTFINPQMVIKLCEQINEKCPVVPFGIQNVRWDIPDPTPSHGNGNIETKTKRSYSDSAEVLHGTNKRNVGKF